jgi:hypothetical protein
MHMRTRRHLAVAELAHGEFARPATSTATVDEVAGRQLSSADRRDRLDARQRGHISVSGESYIRA